MSKPTANKIAATAALTAAIAAAIQAAHEAGLSAADVIAAMEPIKLLLEEEE